MSDEEQSGDEPQARPGRPEWARLHLWQIQPVRDVLVVAGVLLMLVLGERASVVTVPVVVALMLAYLVEPVVRRLTRSGRIGRKSAAALLVLLGLLLFVLPLTLGAGFAVVQGVQTADTLAARAGAVIDSVDHPDDADRADAIPAGVWRDMRDFLVGVGVSEGSDEPDAKRRPENVLLGVDDRTLADVVQAAVTWLRENAQRLAKQLLASGAGAVGAAISTLESLGGLAFGIFLTCFFFFFGCSRWESVTRGAQALLPDKNRERAVHIVREMDRAVSGFIRGRLMVALILGVFYTVAFAVIGVPAPLLLGPAIAFLAIFPYAALLGLPVVIVLLRLEDNPGLRGEFWWTVVTPLVVYQIGQMLDDYVLTPKIQGDATGLDTPTILAASIAGGALLGLFGLLIAIPLAACIRILVVELLVPRYRAWTAGERRDFLPLDEE